LSSCTSTCVHRRNRVDRVLCTFYRLSPKELGGQYVKMLTIHGRKRLNREGPSWSLGAVLALVPSATRCRRTREGLRGGGAEAEGQSRTWMYHFVTPPRPPRPPTSLFSVGQGRGGVGRDVKGLVCGLLSSPVSLRQSVANLLSNLFAIYFQGTGD
jgi:hypothetical protein